MYNIKDNYYISYIMSDAIKKLSLENTFKINNNYSDFYKTTLNEFNNYHNLYDNGLTQKICAYSNVLMVWSFLSILSCISFPIVSNCAIFCMFILYGVYSNIHPSVGNKMISYLTCNYLLSYLLSLLYANHLFMACITFTMSMGTIICSCSGYQTLNTDLADGFSEFQESYLYIAPLYSFTYVENSLNITKNLKFIGTIIITYIKTLFTASVIYEELKDRGVDDDIPENVIENNEEISIEKNMQNNEENSTDNSEETEKEQDNQNNENHTEKKTESPLHNKKNE